MLKTILLQKETVIVFIDESLYEKIPRKGWWINSYGYAVHQKKIGNKRINTYLHHLVLPVKKGFDVDHINRNKLDNRRENLRYVTRAQNIYNMSEKKNNTSGKRGVSWDKQHKKWRAYIGGGKSRKELGLFSNKKTAIDVRVKAESYLINGVIT